MAELFTRFLPNRIQTVICLKWFLSLESFGLGRHDGVFVFYNDQQIDKVAELYVHVWWRACSAFVE